MLFKVFHDVAMNYVFKNIMKHYVPVRFVWVMIVAIQGVIIF